jgi:hypothetical protein
LHISLTAIVFSLKRAITWPDFMDVVFAEMAIACSGLLAVVIAEIHSVNLTPSAYGLARATGLVTIDSLASKMRCHRQRASEVKGRSNGCGRVGGFVEANAERSEKVCQTETDMAVRASKINLADGKPRDWPKRQLTQFRSGC